MFKIYGNWPKELLEIVNFFSDCTIGSFSRRAQLHKYYIVSTMLDAHQKDRKGKLHV
jgi:hypothetical protein